MKEVIEKTEIDVAIERADAALERAVNYLHANGVDYQLSEWVTIKKYCQMYGIKDTNVVSNWIRRGIVPADNIQEIEELNGLKLIKAIPYME